MSFCVVQACRRFSISLLTIFLFCLCYHAVCVSNAPSFYDAALLKHIWKILFYLHRSAIKYGCWTHITEPLYLWMIVFSLKWATRCKLSACKKGKSSVYINHYVLRIDCHRKHERTAADYLQLWCFLES